jgi:hypothetical protein
MDAREKLPGELLVAAVAMLGVVAGYAVNALIRLFH